MPLGETLLVVGIKLSELSVLSAIELLSCLLFFLISVNNDRAGITKWQYRPVLIWFRMVLVSIPINSSGILEFILGTPRKSSFTLGCGLEGFSQSYVLFSVFSLDLYPKARMSISPVVSELPVCGTRNALSEEFNHRCAPIFDC